MEVLLKLAICAWIEFWLCQCVWEASIYYHSRPRS